MLPLIERLSDDFDSLAKLDKTALASLAKAIRQEVAQIDRDTDRFEWRIKRRQSLLRILDLVQTERSGNRSHPDKPPADKPDQPMDKPEPGDERVINGVLIRQSIINEGPGTAEELAKRLECSPSAIKAVVAVCESAWFDTFDDGEIDVVGHESAEEDETGRAGA